MKSLRISLLLLVIASLQLIRAARLARNCNGKFSQTLRCFRDGVNRAQGNDKSFPIPSDSEKRRIDNAVNDCFINQFHCTQSPISTAQQQRDRQDCFNQVKKSLQSQLQQCVRKCVEDFTLPDDAYEPNNDWGYHVTWIKNSVNNPKPLCGNVKKPDLQKCINNIGYDFNRRPPNKVPPYVCQVQADCYFNWGTDCQNTWEYQLVPQLCQCSQDMIKQKAILNGQNQFKTCMAGRGQSNLPRDDPSMKWVDTYIRGMCTTAQNSPCKRELEAASKRSSANNKG